MFPFQYGSNNSNNYDNSGPASAYSDGNIQYVGDDREDQRLLATNDRDRNPKKPEVANYEVM